MKRLVKSSCLFGGSAEKIEYLEKPVPERAIKDPFLFSPAVRGVNLLFQDHYCVPRPSYPPHDLHVFHKRNLLKSPDRLEVLLSHKDSLITEGDPRDSDRSEETHSITRKGPQITSYSFNTGMMIDIGGPIRHQSFTHDWKGNSIRRGKESFLASLKFASPITMA